MLPRNVGASPVLACALLAAACAKRAVPRAVSMDSPPSSMASQPGDRHVLAGEWEQVDIDGAADRLTLDEKGNGRDNWENWRFETHTHRSYLAWHVVSEGE